VFVLGVSPSCTGFIGEVRQAVGGEGVPTSRDVSDVAGLVRALRVLRPRPGNEDVLPALLLLDLLVRKEASVRGDDLRHCKDWPLRDAAVILAYKNATACESFLLDVFRQSDVRGIPAREAAGNALARIESHAFVSGLFDGLSLRASLFLTEAGVNAVPQFFPLCGSGTSMDCGRVRIVPPGKGEFTMWEIGIRGGGYVVGNAPPGRRPLSPSPGRTYYYPITVGTDGLAAVRDGWTIPLETPQRLRWFASILGKETDLHEFFWPSISDGPINDGPPRVLVWTDVESYRVGVAGVVKEVRGAVDRVIRALRERGLDLTELTGRAVDIDVWVVDQRKDRTRLPTIREVLYFKSSPGPHKEER
jgi:hypothetical protein